MYGSSDTFSMWTGSQMYGILEKPRGSVQIRWPSQFFGKIKAKTICRKDQVHVDLNADSDRQGVFIGQSRPACSIGVPYACG
ncbi:MAG: hypothetical protein QHH07_02025 [Sedimentisphaerales bacterium]|nr:hypothetical protein [Sedimentisphaerales bacterium]